MLEDMLAALEEVRDSGVTALSRQRLYSVMSRWAENCYMEMLW
jgi:hypothetical protein